VPRRDRNKRGKSTLPGLMLIVSPLVVAVRIGVLVIFRAP
jgi:hypothetical protein